MGEDGMNGSRRKAIVRLAKITFAILYSLVCTAVILLFSEGDYEWMVGQREPDGSVLTLCTIPTSTDSTSDMAIPTLVLIAVLFVPGVIRLITRWQVGPSLFLSLGLLALWIYRFFIRAVFC
jgi:hypothetical protein